MQQHETPTDTPGHVTAREHQDDWRCYVQTIEPSVLAAVNSRASAALRDWMTPDAGLGRSWRNLKGLMKFGEIDF